MYRIIYSKCPKCESHYFISENFKEDLYECVDCKLVIKFQLWRAEIELTSSKEYDIFFENYNVLGLSELKNTIHQERINFVQAKENEKNDSVQKIKNILNVSYFEAKDYWQKHLQEIVNEEEFNEIITKFILHWFKENQLEIPDIDQAKCIANVWDNVQVVARAGSGKTSTIINKAVFLVKHCNIQPEEILILAFNKEAAEEVNKRLEKVLKHDLPQAMTFHALAYAIVHPKEKLVYDQLERLEKSASVQSVIDSYIHNPNHTEVIKKLMINYFKEDWERIIDKGHNLNKEEMLIYRRSLPYIGLDGRYYKSMGEKRIADYLFEHDIPFSYEKNFTWNSQNYRPDFTINFSNSSLKGIVIEYFGLVGDPEYDKESVQKINYWNNRNDYLFIEMYPKDGINYETIQNLLEAKLKKFFPEMKKLTEDEIWNRIRYRSVDEFSKVCSSFISRCRKLMLTPEKVANLVKVKKHQLSELELGFLRVIWKIYRDYLVYLEQNNEQDFDGLINQSIEQVKQGKHLWRRKKGTGNLTQIKYLFIDEYQDFSLMFNELVFAIKEVNHHLKLFCVGDNWQAINGFAGSDLVYFNDFKQIINNSKRLHIATNYRSNKKIVQAGNQIMMGNGVYSKPYSNSEGEVLITYLDQFIPSEHEKSCYHGDLITPALIRIINSILEKGSRVALLARRKNGLPYYNLHESKIRNFQDTFIEAIRKEFPEDKRNLIVSINTVHAFKGKEQDTIILLDALENSFPLLHPRNVFFEVLGSTTAKVVEEERRLFYVALTRAKERLIIITETNKESPFLKNLLENRLPSKMDINILNPPLKTVTQYNIVVSNFGKTLGTLKIKELLKAYSYKYDVTSYSWRRIVNQKFFNINSLLEEPWLREANNVKVNVFDEFDQEVYFCIIREGKVYKS